MFRNNNSKNFKLIESNRLCDSGVCNKTSANLSKQLVMHNNVRNYDLVTYLKSILF